MPYALCPMPYALCPVVPHMRARKAIRINTKETGFFTKIHRFPDRVKNPVSEPPQALYENTLQLQRFDRVVRYALCPMPYALCPMPYARRNMLLRKTIQTAFNVTEA